MHTSPGVPLAIPSMLDCPEVPVNDPVIPMSLLEAYRFQARLEKE